MKLIYKITIRLSIALTILLGIWAVFFYYTIMDEIHDEVNDALETYSETLIKRTLAGYPLPPLVDGSNNSYFIKEVNLGYVRSVPGISYSDSMIYVPERKETEPARILRTIFMDKDDRYYELTVSIPTIEKNDLIEALFSAIMYLYVGLLLLILIINIYVFHKSLTPLYKLLNWLNSYEIGANNRELKNDTTVKEFRMLNEVTLRHIGRTEEEFKQQKEFIGNASHEMQTPLAVSNNRLEWLIDNTDLTEEQLKELFKTKQTLSNLTKLNKSLLFISKIDNRQFPESTSVNINKLIKRNLEDYQEIYDSRRIELKLIENEELIVNMNDILANSLITNLLKNAFVHNQPGGIINIKFSKSQLEVSNTAIYGSLDKEKLFERFYQRQKKEGSTGLGLVVVQSICKMHNVNIDYLYQNNMHNFRFTWR